MREAARQGEEARNEYVSGIFDKVSRGMAEAAVHSGLADEWKHYDILVPGLSDRHMQAAFKEARRIIRRRNPEVLFRELTDYSYSRLAWINHELQSLKNYSYNRDLVERETLASEKFLAKEGWKMDKCYRRELDAAKSFAWLEEAAKEQRYKEVQWARDQGRSLPGFGKAIGRLLGLHL